MNAPSKRRFTTSPDFGQSTAIAALAFMAANAERLQRFLAVTGLGPHNLRKAASDAAFLASVLDYLAGDERLLVAFAAEQGLTPETVAKARDALAGPPPAYEP